VLITNLQGVAATRTAHAARLGMNESTLRARVYALGWTDEEACTYGKGTKTEKVCMDRVGHLRDQVDRIERDVTRILEMFTALIRSADRHDVRAVPPKEPENSSKKFGAVPSPTDQW
jgi:hypothetical protein